MKVRLLESAHDTWAPAGTVGELKNMGEPLLSPLYKFFPHETVHCGTPDGGLWIGRVKWEEVAESVTVKPRKRGK